MLVPGEMFPTERSIDDDVEGTPMEGVEHLGQYVFEMAQAKMKALGEKGVVVDTVNETGLVDEDEVMLGTIDEEEEQAERVPDGGDNA